MPVEFLTPEQQERYGRFTEEPSAAQLARYFHLDDADRERIAQYRGGHNRFGFALQLCTVRFLGTFLEDPLDVPTGVQAHLAEQLGLSILPEQLHRYRDGETRWDHTAQIRQLHGYREFFDPAEYFRLLRWLFNRTWLSAERPSVLFDLATARLVERKVLLPGVTVLERLVARVRDRAAERLYQVLASLPDADCIKRLEKLLVPESGKRQSPLDRLRSSPTRLSAPALVEAITRLEEIRMLGAGTLAVHSVPPIRLAVLARIGGASRAQAIARMPKERRIATLVAFAHHLEATATDDVLDVLDLLVGELLSRAEREGKRSRLRTLGDLDAAALKLYKACEVVLDGECEDAEVRSTVFKRVGEESLAEAAALVSHLIRPAARDGREELLTRWRTVRLFLPRLLAAITFGVTEAGRPVGEALTFLHSIEGRRQPKMDQAPLGVVDRRWKPTVAGEDGAIDRQAYTFCVLQRLREALHRRDVFVEGSLRYRDPRARLLSGPEWEVSRLNVCRVLGHSTTPDTELEALSASLDQAFRRAAANLATNTAVRVVGNPSRDTFSLSRLDKLAEPSSLLRLRAKVHSLLPTVDLPEVLLEVHQYTGFAHQFFHVSESGERAENLPTSICAVLLAEACNIGLEPLVRQDLPELKRTRLSWVQQNYLRAETLIRANARLVEAQSRLVLARQWGGGEVASADGIRFVVPVRTINAGPNSKYFGVGRGITYYNFTSDQFTGFHGIVIPGTIRDSLYLLEGLLEQQTVLQPTEVMTDTAGYSDVVFGLFYLLGYQFSPRLADVGETRFWRMDAEANYGELDKLARGRIRTELIRENWDDLLRVTGSLKQGTVGATELMRTLQSGSKPSTLSKAIAELGRIAKTLYLLTYIDDEDYRRRILLQLNRGEGRHSLGRELYHGQKGQMRKRYREGQEDQLSALGLVLNVVALWNTRYMEAALQHLRDSGEEVKPEDMARLSPLVHHHINMLGRYSFQLSEPVARGELRPLRDPKEQEEEQL